MEVKDLYEEIIGNDLEEYLEIMYSIRLFKNYLNDLQSADIIDVELVETMIKNFSKTKTKK